jgi:hypothetical protein
MKIPPIQCISQDNDRKFIFIDVENIDELNEYCSSILNVDDACIKILDMYFLCDENINDIMIKEQNVVNVIYSISINKAVVPDTITKQC